MCCQIRIFIDNKLIRFFLRNAGLTIIPACKCAAFIRFRNYCCCFSHVVAGITNCSSAFFGVNINIDIIIFVEICCYGYIFSCCKLIYRLCFNNVISNCPAEKLISFIRMCRQNNCIALSIGTITVDFSTFNPIFGFRISTYIDTGILCNINVFTCSNLLVSCHNRHCISIVFKVIHCGYCIFLLRFDADIIIVQASFYIAVTVTFFKCTVHYAVTCTGDFKGKFIICKGDNLLASAYFGDFNAIIVPELFFTNKADLISV